MRTILLLTCFLVAVIFAVLAFYQHRRRSKANYTNNSNNFTADRSDRFEEVDPIVDGKTLSSQMENGITIKRNDALLKNVINGKTKPEAAIEKKTDNEEPSKEDEARAKQFFPNDYISLTLMAEDEKPYTGYELLQGLLSAGMRFGKRNVFHRYQAHTANNTILFSLASVVKPGTFEMAKMGGFSTPGLILFMRVSTQTDSMMTFELMLETARQLRDDLEGEIKLNPSTPLQEETINEIRQQIGEYEQSKRTTDLFVEEVSENC